MFFQENADIAVHLHIVRLLPYYNPKFFYRFIGFVLLGQRQSQPAVGNRKVRRKFNCFLIILNRCTDFALLTQCIPEVAQYGCSLVGLAQGLISSRIVEITSLFEGLSVAQVVVPKELVGRKIGEIKFRQKYKCNIVIIKRKADQSDLKGDSSWYNMLPEPDDEIRLSDILVIVGTEIDIERFAGSL